MAAAEKADEISEESARLSIEKYQQDVVDIILTLRNEKQDIDPELEEWFKQFQENDKKYFTDVCNAQTRKDLFVPLTQLMLVLRECLLSHRWSEAATVLFVILQSPTSCRHTILRVGTELMYNLPYENNDMLEQFVSQMKRFREVVGMEVVLEYALYLLMIGKSDAASKWMRDFPNDRFTVRKPTKVEESAQNRFMAFHGLTRYCEYRAMKAALDQQPENTNDYSLSGTSSSAEHSLAVTKAKEALDSLRAAIEEELPVYWDYFIIAQVELLEFLERSTEALDLLNRYAAHNPDNPNTHRYLMQFYQRHNQPEQDIFHMQRFCDAVPSDEMVMELHGKLVSRGSPAAETLPLIFDLLDYGTWASHIKPWKLLSKQLRTITTSGSREDQSSIADCWSVRQSWWPSYHFRTDRGEQHHELLLHKAIVAAALMGPECTFIQYVLECGMPSKQTEHLGSFLLDLG